MATFLQLAQRLRQEAGIAGTGPATVVNQTGQLRQIVDWTQSAWNDIQLSQQSWRWMVGEFSFSTVAGQRRYTPAECGISSRFARWHVASMRCNQFGPQDEISLGYVTYDEFRDTYIVGPQTQARPVCVTQYPNRDLGLGYTPNLVYTVSGDYQKAPQVMTLDADVPEMPEQFHDLIWQWALKKYARSLAAAEIYEDAVTESRRLMTALCMDQLPDIYAAEPLL